MPVLIHWLPLQLGSHPETDSQLELIDVPPSREIGGRWIGVNSLAQKQFFALQLHLGRKDATDRMAVLIGDELEPGGKRSPLKLTQDHVADAAGFLGFRWFEWISTRLGKATISEELPPDDTEIVSE